MFSFDVNLIAIYDIQKSKEIFVSVFTIFVADQRLTDIKYWEKEVDDKLDAIKIETDNLLAFRTRVEKAIESCKEPLHIAQQCLVNR